MSRVPRVIQLHAARLIEAAVRSHTYVEPTVRRTHVGKTIFVRAHWRRAKSTHK